MKINFALAYQKYWNREKMEPGANQKLVKLMITTVTNLDANCKP